MRDFGSSGCAANREGGTAMPGVWGGDIIKSGVRWLAALTQLFPCASIRSLNECDKSRFYLGPDIFSHSNSLQKWQSGEVTFEVYEPWLKLLFSCGLRGTNFLNGVTYIHTYLPIYLPTHLHACLPTYLPTYVRGCVIHILRYELHFVSFLRSTVNDLEGP